MNKYQAALLNGYRNVDTLPFDRNNPDDVQRAVDTRTTGDSLFNFLWNELADAGSAAEAIEMVESAIADLNSVLPKLEDIAACET